MFVKETQFSSSSGPWWSHYWCDRNVKKCYRFMYKFYLLPLEPFVLASLGALWPGTSAACTPAPGGTPCAHLTPPNLPSRREQADIRKKLWQQPSTLFQKHMGAEFKKTQWPRCLTTGARHMAKAARGRTPGTVKQQSYVVW